GASFCPRTGRGSIESSAYPYTPRRCGRTRGGEARFSERATRRKYPASRSQSWQPPSTRQTKYSRGASIRLEEIPRPAGSAGTHGDAVRSSWCAGCCATTRAGSRARGDDDATVGYGPGHDPRDGGALGGPRQRGVGDRAPDRVRAFRAVGLFTLRQGVVSPHVPCRGPADLAGAPTG